MEQAINVQSLAQKRRTYFKHPGSLIVFLLTWLAALLTMGVLVFLIGYILIKGVPFLTPDLFKLEYNSDNVSMLPALINTLLMTVLALLIAGPLGIFAAIYMVEYAKKGNKVVGVVRVTAETLSGIPSIVYGLFGALFFVTFLHLRLSLISGALTVAIMVLPTILRTTEEALIAVPASFREGSFGLGSRQASYRISDRITICGTGHSFRCNSCNRTNRRRNGSADLYSRNNRKTAPKPVIFYENLIGAYVYAVGRRISHGSGICNRCNIADIGYRDQLDLEPACKQINS